MLVSIEVSKAASISTLEQRASITKCPPQSNRLLEIERRNPNIKCAILIDDDLVFPRNITSHKGDIWLVDKGSNLFSNGNNSGAIYRYQASDHGYTRTQVLTNLDDPNDLSLRRHESGEYWAYFTTRNSVQRFKISDQKNVRPKVVIADLPTFGWHKLMAITVTQSSLYLTMPSLTDHCEVDGLPRLVEYPCGEDALETATIRSYSFTNDDVSNEYTVLAKGLRDALATQITPRSNQLIVADNGWDQIDLSDSALDYKNTPHDEINVIDLNTSDQIPHYGWPYCFNQKSITPPYQRFIESCDAYHSPAIKLPAHSAPLGMMYFGNELLINLHGNNESGGKTVAFQLDNNGLPIGNSVVKINWQYETQKNQTLGRPLGLAPLSTSELLVTDDWNHQLIKIVFNDK